MCKAKKGNFDAKTTLQGLLALLVVCPLFGILAVSFSSIENHASLSGADEPVMGVNREEVTRVFSQQHPENAGRALHECARKIVGYLGLDHQAGHVPTPPYKDFSHGEFLYSWGQGSMELQSVLGEAGISASCMGTLKPFKIEHVSVNGKSIL